MAEIQAVIFDCDGVLFHSERANIAFFNEVLRRMGEPSLDTRGERLATSMAGSQLVRALFPEGDPRIQRAREVAQALDYDPFYRWMEPVPDLEAVLAELRRSFRLAMASNRGVTVPGVLERFRLQPFFEIAVGTLDVAQPKPAPDMLLRCVEFFSLEPRQALYVGDAPTDWQAAQAAGMSFVAIGPATGAPQVLSSLAELPAYLRTLC